MNTVNKIISLIDSNGITKNKLLTDLGLSKNSFVNWENRGTSPRGETLSKIAAYFDVSTDYLLGQISETEELLRHISDDNKKDFNKFIVALNQLNKNGQEIAYDYIDTLVKSGKYSPDNENIAIGIAAKGGVASTTADNTSVDTEIAKRKHRKS